MKAAKPIAASLISLILAAAAVISAAAPRAHALADGTADVGRYACATARDVYFCESKDLSAAKFVLPYRYCVLVLGEEDGWYNVRYAEETQYYRPLYGWCQKNGVTVLGDKPDKIFLDMPVTITIKVELPSETLPALAETVTVAYYGEYYSGAVPLSCVMYKNEFFYVPQTFEYPPNDVVTEPPEPDAGGRGADVKLITAVALSALAISALVILYFAGRKPRFRRPDP